MVENFSLEWNMKWKIFSMEWKKIASLEYGKILFHSIPYHALIPARPRDQSKKNKDFRQYFVAYIR